MSQSFKIQGDIVRVGETEAKSASFYVRELILSLSDGKYENFAVLQFTGDKCGLLDGYGEGETVAVDFDVRGREWQGRYFSNLTGWRIARVDEMPLPGGSTPTPTGAASGGGLDDDEIPF